MHTASSSRATATARGRHKRPWRQAMAVLGVFVFSAGVALSLMVGLFTSRVATPLPALDITSDDREALLEKWGLFQHQVTSGQPTAPFAFSSREFHVFCAMMPRLRSRVSGTFEQDYLHIRFSSPLGLGPIRRYTSGAGRVQIGVHDQKLVIRVVACQLNGRALPRWICRQLGRRCFNPEAFRILDESGLLPYLQEIIIRDDVCFLTARPPAPSAGNQ